MNRNQDTRPSSLRSLVLRAAALLLLAFGLLVAPAWADGKPCVQCGPCDFCNAPCMDYDTQKECGAFGTCLDGTRYACANVCDGGSPASMGCYTGNNCDQTTCGGYWWGDTGSTCGVDPSNGWAWESMEYFHYDALGSVRLVVDFPVSNSNYTIARHDYLPFGEEIQAGTFGRTADLGYGFDPTPRRFTGKERDTESGLDYFGARYYSGAQGRFTSADEPFADQSPDDPQSWNLYSYVRNQPLSFVDPSGRQGEFPTTYFYARADMFLSQPNGFQLYHQQVMLDSKLAGFELIGRAGILGAIFGGPPVWTNARLFLANPVGAAGAAWATAQTWAASPAGQSTLLGAGEAASGAPPGALSLGAQMGLGLTTARGEAFFWSGRTAGVGGEAVAANLARASGGTTLEMLLQARGLPLPTTEAGWAAVSREFARGASGTVRAVVGQSTRARNLWVKEELPALLRNPHVDRIIRIDPATQAETLIFQR